MEIIQSRKILRKVYNRSQSEHYAPHPFPLINSSDHHWLYGIKAIHYIWRGFESWYLLRLLPFHQDQDLLLLFSAFLGLEWLGFAKRFPSNKIGYISLKHHIFLWIRICHFGKEPEPVQQRSVTKKIVFALWKLKWSNSPLKPLPVFANLRIQERLYTFLRPSAIALKTSTGCVHWALPTHLLICWRLETNFL